MSGGQPADEKAGSGVGRVRELVTEEKKSYEGDSDRPLGTFAAIMGTYGAAVAGAGILVARRRQPLPERLGAADLALMTVATHKLSRLLAKDVVTSPLRAPFTRFAGTAGPGELQEKVRGEGPRKGVGALVTCPFCLAMWVATGFTFGFVLAPRGTRLAASVLTAVTGADILQFAYSKLEETSG